MLLLPAAQVGLVHGASRGAAGRDRVASVLDMGCGSGALAQKPMRCCSLLGQILTLRPAVSLQELQCCGSPHGGAGKLRAPCVSPRGSAGASSRQPVACRQPLHSGSHGLSRNRQIIPLSGWGCWSCMGEGLCIASPEAQEGLPGVFRHKARAAAGGPPALPKLH